VGQDPKTERGAGSRHRGAKKALCGLGPLQRGQRRFLQGLDGGLKNQGHAAAAGLGLTRRGARSSSSARQPPRRWRSGCKGGGAGDPVTLADQGHAGSRRKSSSGRERRRALPTMMGAGGSLQSLNAGAGVAKPLGAPEPLRRSCPTSRKLAGPPKHWPEERQPAPDRSSAA